MRWGECDLLAVSKAGYVTEYEIKMSMHDFKREWKKNRWIGSPGNPGFHYSYRAFKKMVKFYWIVVPGKLAAKVEPLIPEHIGAGLISVSERSTPWRVNDLGFEETRPAILNSKAQKITDEQRMNLGRLAAMRYWNLARKMHEK